MSNGRILAPMLIAWIPVVAIIVGLLLWFVATNAKVAEAGRLTFAAGMAVTLLVLARQVLRLG